MRLGLIAVGRIGSGPERELVRRYLERARPLARAVGFSGPEEVEIADGRATNPETRRAEEARIIRARCPGATLVALDERGESLPTAAFADALRRWRGEGVGDVALVIGGHDGLDPDLAGAAALRLAFGRQTWPHRLVRVLAAEQIYRALTILVGHPYHRE